MRHPQFTQSSSPSKPFLKWAGGKQRLLPQLLPLLPRGKRLIEPFVGAGAVFLAAPHPQVAINDANPDLVAVWNALKQRPDDFIHAASKLFTPSYQSADAYMHLRDDFNASKDPWDRAALLVYLNRFSFNGLYRVNRSGGFNVPYGDPKRLPSFPEADMRLAAERLARCNITCGDFERSIGSAEMGDIVYCDPPYSQLTSRSSFTAYTTGGFTTLEHLRLVMACESAVRRGATVVVSNHDTESNRLLYEGWTLHSVSVRRSISANASRRTQANELIAILGGP